MSALLVALGFKPDFLVEPTAAIVNQSLGQVPRKQGLHL